MTRTGSLGHVGGGAKNGFVAEDRECNGFTRTVRDAVLVGGENGEVAHAFAQQAHEGLVHGTAAADDKRFDFVPGANETVVGVGDALGDGHGDGGDDVLVVVLAATRGDGIAEIDLDAEFFAPRAFRGFLVEIGMREEVFEEFVYDDAFGGGGTVLVVGLFAAGKETDGTVNRHVGGAGVEGIDLVEFRGNDGEIGNAAKVERGDTFVFFLVAPQQPVCIGNERRALAACGDVAGAEVGDDGESGAFGNDSGLADLKRTAGDVGGRGKVGDGVAVGGDEVGFYVFLFGDFDHFNGGVGEAFAEFGVEKTDLFGGHALVKETPTEIVGIGKIAVSLEFEDKGGSGTFDADEDRINAVAGSAGHEADDESGAFLSVLAEVHQ